MLLFLSIVSGAFISVMLVQNGGLAEQFGNYRSSVIVHIVGLTCILLWMFLRREKFRWDKTTPPAYYLGGVLGVITVVTSNLCFFSLGVSLTLALGLFGQCLFGGIVDHFGLFGLPMVPFRKQHLISFGFIISGIAIMYLL